MQKVMLVTNTNEFVIDEIFEVSIKISDMNVSAMQLEIIYDTNMLEFVSGSENMNNKDNRIIFSWFDENGGKTPKTSGEIIDTFSLKTKNTGTTYIEILGEFYDSNRKCT